VLIGRSAEFFTSKTASYAADYGSYNTSDAWKHSCPQCKASGCSSTANHCTADTNHTVEAEPVPELFFVYLAFFVAAIVQASLSCVYESNRDPS